MGDFGFGKYWKIVRKIFILIINHFLQKTKKERHKLTAEARSWSPSATATEGEGNNSLISAKHRNERSFAASAKTHYNPPFVGCLRSSSPKSPTELRRGYMQTGANYDTAAPRLSIAPPPHSWKYKFFENSGSQKFFSETQNLKEVNRMRHEILAEEEELSPANRQTGADRQVIMKRHSGMHSTTMNRVPVLHKDVPAEVTEGVLEGDSGELEEKVGIFFREMIMKVWK